MVVRYAAEYRDRIEHGKCIIHTVFEIGPNCSRFVCRSSVGGSLQLFPFMGMRYVHSMSKNINQYVCARAFTYSLGSASFHDRFATPLWSFQFGRCFSKQWVISLCVFSRFCDVSIGFVVIIGLRNLRGVASRATAYCFRTSCHCTTDTGVLYATEEISPHPLPLIATIAICFNVNLTNKKKTSKGKVKWKYNFLEIFILKRIVIIVCKVEYIRYVVIFLWSWVTFWK